MQGCQDFYPIAVAQPKYCRLAPARPHFHWESSFLFWVPVTKVINEQLVLLSQILLTSHQHQPACTSATPHNKLSRPSLGDSRPLPQTLFYSLDEWDGYSRENMFPERNKITAPKRWMWNSAPHQKLLPVKAISDLACVPSAQKGFWNIAGTQYVCWWLMNWINKLKLI